MTSKKQIELKPLIPAEIIAEILAGKKISKQKLEFIARHCDVVQRMSDGKDREFRGFRNEVFQKLELLEKQFKELEAGAKSISQVARRVESKCGALGAWGSWERASDFVARTSEILFPNRANTMTPNKELAMAS